VEEGHLQDIYPLVVLLVGLERFPGLEKAINDSVA
jgi:hypothetical protein